MAHAQLFLKITGRVQGVFFRSAAQEKAQELGIVGWVRNALDGSVECCAEGSKETLEVFRTWMCRGPRGALVEQCDATWNPATGLYDAFRIETTR